MKVSFVIPVFNNADTLPVIAEKIESVSSEQHWDHEIIFVDDCSSDNSVKIISQLPKNCFGIHLKKNQGQSTAILVGMKYASGDTVVILDADLQDNPAFVPLMISELQNDIDVVFSGRTGSYEKKSKLFSAKGFKYILHLLSKKRLPENACLFFAINKYAVAKLLPFAGSKPYLLSVIAKTGLKCTSIPYNREANQFGNSSYNFIKRWKVGLKGIYNFFLLHRHDFDPNLISIIKTLPETRQEVF